MINKKNKTILDFKVFESKKISKMGELLHQCLISKDEEIKNTLIKRGRWDSLTKETKNELYRKTPIYSCLNKILKENKDTEIALIGTMCSGKSTFWRLYNPESDQNRVKMLAEKGLDEEGYKHLEGTVLGRYYTTHDIYRLPDELDKDDGIIVIDRDLDDKIECVIEERKHWEDLTREKARKELISQKKTINNILQKAKTNIFKVKWIQEND